MYKKIFFILLLIFVSQSIVFSQLSRMRRDGLYWTALDAQKKYNYVVGYSRGIFIGSNAVIEKYVKGSKCYKKSTAAIDSLTKSLYSLDVDYAIFRIDSMYKADSLNMGLMVFHSYLMVITQLSEGVTENFNQMYYYFRREDCDKFKSFDELKNYKLSY